MPSNGPPQAVAKKVSRDNATPAHVAIRIYPSSRASRQPDIGIRPRERDASLLSSVMQDSPPIPAAWPFYIWIPRRSRSQRTRARVWPIRPRCVFRLVMYSPPQTSGRMDDIQPGAIHPLVRYRSRTLVENTNSVRNYAGGKTNKRRKNKHRQMEIQRDADNECASSIPGSRFS